MWINLNKNIVNRNINAGTTASDFIAVYEGRTLKTNPYNYKHRYGFGWSNNKENLTFDTDSVFWEYKTSIISIKLYLKIYYICG